MPKRYVTQFGDRESVDEFFLASEKQLRTNRNGVAYLQVRLSDKSGSVTAMMWNVEDDDYSRFENGDYVRARATAQLYNGAIQFILSGIEAVRPERVDPDDFITLQGDDVAKLKTRLTEILKGLRNHPCRALGESFLADGEFMRKFSAAPAGVKNHHAYKGGLLQHVVSLMEMCLLAASHYQEIDGDLLLLGALLHDAGKIDELTYERDLGYSDEGQLIGHVVQGVSMLEAKVRKLRETGVDFPRELELRIKHMIVSHHGQYEFGSPKLPMTIEAIALHYLDDLDAKLFTVGQLMREDNNVDSAWTPYFPSLQRKFFKGKG